MKLLLVIDHLGTGGAQNQIVRLAAGLKQNGLEVSFFIYYPQYDHFRNYLDSNSIPVYGSSKERRGFSVRVLKELRRELKMGRYDGVISYLDTPNIYTELASAGLKGLRVIVSERNSYLREKPGPRLITKRVLHSFADHIVANSKTQSDWLKRKFPWLRKKTLVIYNGFDPGNFRPKPLQKPMNRLRLIGIGRIAYQKNIINLIKGLELFYNKHNWGPSVCWAGSLEDSAEPEYKVKVMRLLDELPEIKSNWTWLGERNDIPELLADNHALVLPSFFEGFPNVVCEAMFSARPVLLSDVCDHSFLVKDGERGFLFEPAFPESIAWAITSLVEMDGDQWLSMCENNLRFANENLVMDRMVKEYLMLLNQ